MFVSYPKMLFPRSRPIKTRTDVLSCPCHFPQTAGDWYITHPTLRVKIGALYKAKFNEEHPAIAKARRKEEKRRKKEAEAANSSNNNAN
jgi:hypothetical protein